MRIFYLVLMLVKCTVKLKILVGGIRKKPMDIGDLTVLGELFGSLVRTGSV